MCIVAKIYYHIKIQCKKLVLKAMYKKKLFFGKNIYWRSNFIVRVGKKAFLKIGDNVFFNDNCSLNCLGTIKIGCNTLFGENVKLYDHNHNFKYKDKLISRQGYKIGKIKVGDNCWIGSNVILLKGAEVGDNVVIGAGCIISTKIPSDSIVTANRNIKVEKIKYI